MKENTMNCLLSILESRYDNYPSRKWAETPSGESWGNDSWTEEEDSANHQSSSRVSKTLSLARLPWTTTKRRSTPTTSARTVWSLWQGRKSGVVVVGWWIRARAWSDQKKNLSLFLLQFAMHVNMFSVFEIFKYRKHWWTWHHVNITHWRKLNKRHQ